MLVSLDGYPLAYDIFEGNKYEGHTMLPIIESFKQKYRIEKLVVVADSGLLSTDNVLDFMEKGYEFILGARIKNESKDVKQKTFSLNLINGEIAVIPKGNSRFWSCLKSVARIFSCFIIEPVDVQAYDIIMYLFVS